MIYSPASIIAIAVIFSVLPTLGVSLRIWARKVKKVPLGIDDYLILPALVRIAILLSRNFPNQVSSVQYLLMLPLSCVSTHSYRYQSATGIDRLCVAVVKGEHGSHQKLGPNGELIHDSALDVYQKVWPRNFSCLLSSVE